VAGRLVIGTSSWADPGFVEEWYPKGLPSDERLPWYAERFEAVELNASFYAVPARDSAARWAAVTPDGFSFDVKLHRLLSHHAAPPESLPRELREGVDVTPRGRAVVTDDLQRALVGAILEAVEPLARAGKLSSFLLQLSPAFEPRRHELSELDVVLGALAPHRVAVELRHRAWTRAERLEDTLAYLERWNAAWVSVDTPAGEQVTIMPPIDAVTSRDLAYMRLHGRNAPGYVKGRTVPERFAWSYTDDELCEIARRAKALAEGVPEVRIMANNNRGADAPHAARRLRELLGQVDPTDEQLRLAG
jgi:uncharacterized protein YecE (DUF72 family)